MKKPNIFKRLTAIIMVVVMSVTFIPFASIAGIDLGFIANANGAEEVKTGYCGAQGDNVTYTLYDNGLLVISGQGEMEDYDSSDSPPYRGSIAIVRVSIGSNITRIGNYAFCDCDGLTSVTISDSVISIGEDSFNFCYDLEVVDFTGSEEQWNNISIESGNGFLTSATINYYCNCEHINTTLYDQLDATCTEDGYTAGEYCEDCKTWVDGHETINKHHTNLDGDNICDICGEEITVIKSGFCGETKYDEYGDYSGYSDNATYTLYEDGSLVISGTGKMADFYLEGDFPIIPYASYKWKDEDHYYDTTVKSVIIKNGITYIGKYAFDYFSGLTTLILPDSVTDIGYRALRGCYSVKDITLGNGIVDISDFSDLSGLQNIFVSDNNTSFSSVDGVLFSKDKTVIVKYPEGRSAGEYIIPEGVKTIGYGAFRECCLNDITIPSTVELIGKDAFYGCSFLNNFTVPSTVERIGEDAFYGTGWYRTQPYGDLYIGNIYYEYKFDEEDGIPENTSIAIKDGTIGISDYAFYRLTGLTEITIPDSVRYIGNSAFKNCTDLTSITLGSGVTSIGQSAFRYCTDLTNISLGSGVTSIGDYAFSECYELTSITIPDSVTSIGRSAFSGCTGLTNISLGSGVTSIGDWAFSECYELTSIIIPESVTNIGNYPFSYCDSLTRIDVNENNQNYSSIDGVLFNKNNTEIIQYPTGNSRTSYEVPDSVTSIGSYTFSDCTALTSIIIPDSVTSIGEGAFDSCTGLTNIVLPDSITNIDYWGFYNCTGLTNIVIPDSVTSISDSAFEDCSSLSNITFPDTITYIGTSAFDNTAWYDLQPDGDLYIGKVYYKYKGEMPENTQIVIKDGVTCISGRAFYNCSGLKNIIIPNSVTSIGRSAFENCSALTKITIPDSVTDLSDYTFSRCTALTSISIFDKVASIGYGTFSQCWNISDVYYAGSEEQWNGISVSIFNDYLTNATIHYNYNICYHKNTTNYAQQYPTCTEDGYTAGVFCEDCKSWILEQTVIKKHHIDLDEDKICDVCGKEAKNIISSGTCGAQGDNLTWEFFDNGELIISGQGAMKGWLDCYWPNVSSVTIENGVTSIGDAVFCGYNTLTNVFIPVSVTYIGNYAFSDCNNLKDIYYEGSEEEWNSINISFGDEYEESNESLQNATIHFNCKPVHTHSYISSITTQATCTQEGVITYTCSCGDSYTVSIPMLDHIFKDTMLITPTVFAEGKAIRTCDNCDYSEEIILDKLESNTITDNSTGVSVIFENEAYNTDIELKVTLNSNTDLFEIEDTIFNRFASYDIATLHDGEKVQPAQSIWICVPLPEGFDENNTVVYYVSPENTKEKINSFCEDGKVYFNAEHFSEYVIVDESSVIEPNNNCSCICHKTGFVGFIYKIVRLFWRLFKIKLVCQCGVNHY